MGLLSFAVLLLSFAFLAIKYPDMLRSWIPGWVASGEKTTSPEQQRHPATEPEIAPVKQEEAGELTPKANPSRGITDAPTLTLSSEDEFKAERTGESEPPVPSFPAANSAQRASQMSPPPKPTSQSNLGHMPPPSRPATMPRPSAAASLRLPTTGPLPNRGLPASSQQRVSSALSPTSAIKTPSARGKVLLAPGHSPMDWAALTRKGNLAGVSTFQRVRPSQLKQMTGRKGKPAWSSWQGRVYNITPYLPFHPGGEAELMKAAGRDGTKLFNEVHPWVNWENMLGSCLVGVMVHEDYDKSSLEDMD